MRGAPGVEMGCADRALGDSRASSAGSGAAMLIKALFKIKAMIKTSDTSLGV